MGLEAMDHDRRNKHPRMLTEAERERVEEYIDSIHYSSRYVLDLLERCLLLVDELTKQCKVLG